MATFDELKTKAQEIKNEILPEANTANRVGVLMEEMVDGMAQIEQEIIIFDASSSNQFFSSIEEAAASVPEDKRKRNLIISYKKNDNVVCLSQFYTGNPRDEGWLNPVQWRDIESPSLNSILTLQYDTDVNTTRSQVPYYLRRKGQLLKYTYNDITCVEEIQTDNKAGLFLEESNFLKIVTSEKRGFSNVSSKSASSLTFAQAVSLIPIQDRVRNHIVSYMTPAGVVLMQLREGSPSSEFEKERAWKILSAKDLTNIVDLQFVGSRVETRKTVRINYRRAGTWITYFDTENEERVVEEVLNNYESDDYFSRDSNFRQILPAESQSSIETTYAIKEAEISAKSISNKTSRGVIHAKIGDNIGSTENINLPASKNVVIRFGLHTSALTGENIYDEYHLDGNSLTDFSDVRFTDRLDSPLEHEIVNVLKGYDIIRNSNYKMVNYPLQDGRVISSNTNYSVVGDGVSITADNSLTYTQLQEKVLIGVSKNGVIYSRGIGSDGNKLYRMAPNLDGGYTPNSEILVHSAQAESPTVFNIQGFAEDSIGNLYTSKYQDAWDAEIYKSTDNGLTWNTIFRDQTFTHVHHIYIDNRDYIYVGLDGSRNEGRRLPECMYSTDGGETWDFLPIPFKNRDYGIVYTGIDDKGRRYGIGCGEANVHTGPTLYKTLDFETFYPVLNTLQGVRSVRAFGRMLIAGGNIGWGNRTGQLYMSEDYGETWKTIHEENWEDVTDVGAGLRFMTQPFVPQGGTKEIMIVHGYGGNNLKPVVIEKNSSVNYALCKINTKGLSALRVKWGYSIPYENANVYSNITDGLIRDYRFDEGAGSYIEEYCTRSLLHINGEYDWLRGDVKHYELTAPTRFYSRNAIILAPRSYLRREITDTFRDGFTISFWANFKEDSNEGFIWGDPAGINAIIIGDRLHIRRGTTTVVSRNITMWFGWDAWVKYCISISKMGISVYIYNAMYATNETTTWVDITNNIEFIGGTDSDNTCNFPLSGIKVYNRALTYKEMLADYLGFVPAVLNTEERTLFD